MGRYEFDMAFVFASFPCVSERVCGGMNGIVFEATLDSSVRAEYRHLLARVE